MRIAREAECFSFLLLECWSLIDEVKPFGDIFSRLAEKSGG
jgi:hypothetical protein